MVEFFPEGFIIDNYDNLEFLKSETSLAQAKSLNKILESKAILCDNQKNLIVDLK